jgi:hypothetical protein
MYYCKNVQGISNIKLILIYLNFVLYPNYELSGDKCNSNLEHYTIFCIDITYLHVCGGKVCCGAIATGWAGAVCVMEKRVASRILESRVKSSNVC